MQNYPPPVSPPSQSVVSLSPSPALLLFEWREERLSGLKISWRNVSVYSTSRPIFRKRFSCSGHLWIDLLWVTMVQSDQYKGIIKDSYRPRDSDAARSARCSPSCSHFLLPSRLVPLLLHPFHTFQEGRPPHSAVSEIKGMSMFIWHTESQSWLNSLTMRQMCFTVARETKLTLGGALCVKSWQEVPSVHSSERKDKLCSAPRERMTVCSKGWNSEMKMCLLHSGWESDAEKSSAEFVIFITVALPSWGPVLAARDERREGTILFLNFSVLFV